MFIILEANRAAYVSSDHTVYDIADETIEIKEIAP